MGLVRVVGWFILWAVVGALIFLGVAYGAPAPLPKRNCADPLHPKWLCGKWYADWRIYDPNRPAFYGHFITFRPDGTLHQRVAGMDEIGRWRVDSDSLHVEVPGDGKTFVWSIPLRAINSATGQCAVGDKGWHVSLSREKE